MRAVVAYRTDGLGGRLMAFGNGLRLARVLRVPCWLAWDRSDEAAGIADPGQLLDMQRLGAEATVTRLARSLADLGKSRILFDGGAEVVDHADLASADVLLCGLGRIQRLSGETLSPRLRWDLAVAMGAIAPAPPLARRIQAFAALRDLSTAVGVHVRRGDLVGHAIERERLRLVGLDRYFSVLDAVAADRPLFLCTEDLAVLDAFDARYPGRVLRHPTRSWSRDDPAAAAEALIEMFLLARTHFIVGGPSAFSRFAAARRAMPPATLYESHSLEQSIEIARAVAEIARQMETRLGALARGAARQGPEVARSVVDQLADE